jgi:hypothetical protein
MIDPRAKPKSHLRFMALLAILGAVSAAATLAGVLVTALRAAILRSAHNIGAGPGRNCPRRRRNHPDQQSVGCIPGIA